MERCFIFAAGTLFELHERPEKGDLVIAADAGYRYCLQEKIDPDLIMGDFDSMEQPANGTVLKFPVEKDDTDTMLAVREGLKRGCSSFYIYGGTGGKRLDHTLSNLQTLAFIRKNGAHGYLYDDHFVYTVLENETFTIKKTVEWGLLSLFSMGRTAETVCIEGVQYPAKGLTLGCDFPIGCSNHILEDKAVISVGEGPLLVGWELS